MVPRARLLVAANVLAQWVGLAATIVLFFAIGTFLAPLAGEERGAFAEEGLPRLIAVAGVAIAVRMACQTLAGLAGQKAAAEAKRTVRRAVYDKLVRLGPSYREAVPTAKAVQVAIEGTEQLESYFGQYLPQLAYALAAPITLFACLAPVSLPAALTLLVLVPLIPASIVAVQKLAKRTMRTYWDSYTDLGGRFLESIQGLTTLKIYQADEACHAAMDAEAERFRKATMNLLKMQLNSITVMDLFAFGGAAVGIIVVLLQYASGAVGFAGAFTFVFLSAEFFIPLRTLGSFFHTAMNGLAAADTMFAILDASEPAQGARAIDPRSVDIELQGVGYAYAEERAILHDVHFSAPQGSFVGIAGESGSGKSTLVGILAGRNASYSGSVRVGGVELREASAASLHEAVVLVSHDSYLFKGTVRSNLQMACENASEDALWEALSRARCDFVRALGGLDAPVAAGGTNLSGGQRQRIALARALLRDAPVYLFDEVTSNVDAASENALIEAIVELSHTHTVIMVSHRLQALEQARCIYVMEQGRVVEAAPHAELTRADGAYARMWAQQSALERRTAEDVASNGEGAVAQSAADAAAVACDKGAGDGDGEAALDGRRDECETSAESDDCAEAPRRSALSIMVRLVGLTKDLLPVMALAIVLGVAGFLAAIFLTTFAAAYMVQGAYAAGAIGGFVLLAAVGACGVVRGPLRYGEQLCNHYLAFRILALVRSKVFAAMRSLAPAKMEGKDKGDLVSLVTADVELLEVFYAHTLSPAAIALVVSGIMVAFIGAQSPVLGVLAFAAYATVGVVVPFVASRASGSAGRAARDGVGSINTFVLDSLRGLHETIQFGTSHARRRELDARMARLEPVELRLKGATSLFIAATGAVVMAFDIAMLAVSSALVAEGSLEFSRAVLATAALMSSFGPVIAVAALGSTLQQTLASGARVLDLLDEKPQTEEVRDACGMASFTGMQAYEVVFSYGDGPRVLEGVDFSIEPGSVVQIAGPSGAGKSTLLKLIMRFWDPSSGALELSGVDLRSVNTADLRRMQGYLTQETHVFAGSIRDNVMFVRPDASEEELHTALEKAALGEFISRLPRGVDSSVGELGDALSGGERQRIGIARMFLHDAPLMLLDEPTSNLDALSEAAVLDALMRNREGKTVVLVSHRASTARIADAVVSVG